MRGATSTYPSVQVVCGGRRDEVVVVAGQELETARLWRERPERDREVHELERFVAHRDDPRVGVRNSARLIFVLRYVVDNIFLYIFVFCARCVHRTDEIRLIVLEF